MICSEVFLRARRVLRDLIIIPHLFPFVKRFLKSFLKFFEDFLEAFQSLFLPGEDVPEYYITFSRVCQEVFQKFFNFFRDSFFSVAVAVTRSMTAQLSDSLHIIALSFPFVNRFLQSFLSLEIRCGLYKTRALRLYTMPIKCQFLSQIGECAGSVMLIFHALTPSRRTSAF